MKDFGWGNLMVVVCLLCDVLCCLIGCWGMLVLVVLIEGLQCFSVLCWWIDGISEWMLVQILQGFESDGMVLWYDFQIVLLYVEYVLIFLGFEVVVCVDGLLGWIEDCLFEIVWNWLFDMVGVIER